MEESKMVLRTEDLVKKYGKRTVVSHVSINVKQGEIVGLLGPNGAGKTTSFYMTVGLITPNEGRIFLDDLEITKYPVYKRAQTGIGYLAQEASVFRQMTVEDNIASVLEMTNKPLDYQKDKLESLIAEFRLQKVRKNKGTQLSGGERRRTEIARCLAIDPKFIMLDEPFAGVDPIAVEDIQQIVWKLKDKNIGILITDHNVQETLSITDRAYLLFEGKILFQGTPEESPGEFCYFDSYQDAPDSQPEAIGGYLPLAKVYSFNPVPDTLSADKVQLVYGVQANLFTEYIPTPEHAEMMIYPRILALAEVAWSDPSVKNYDDFHARALKEVEALKAEGYHPFDLKNEIGNRPGADQPIQHLAVGKKVTYGPDAAYYPGYSAGGDSALVDGVIGGWTYGDKRWQGFIDKKRMDVTIDMEKETEIHSVGADFMQVCGPEVFMPSEVIISVSNDGKEFTELKRMEHKVVKDDKVTFTNFGWEGNAKARYIRYQASSGEFGGFLFTDEIVVK